jgi:hypothetical protein
MLKRFATGTSSRNSWPTFVRGSGSVTSFRLQNRQRSEPFIRMQSLLCLLSVHVHALCFLPTCNQMMELY